MKRVVVQVAAEKLQADSEPEEAVRLEATLSEENVQLVLETVLCLNGKSHLKSSDHSLRLTL